MSDTGFRRGYGGRRKITLDAETCQPHEDT